MFMIHLSQICILAIYCISIPQRALMCNIDEIAIWILLYDTCCLSQNIPTTSSSLIVSCDVFEIFLVEIHSYTISENWSHRLYMLLSKHPLVYFMTSSWIPCLIYFINLLCVHVSLWIILSTLETYIHERVNPSPWYPLSLPTIFSILLVSMGLVRIWFMSAWFSFIAYLCTHIS